MRDEDDPFRFLHHFYDPVNNRGLNATGPLGLPVRGERAPDWALEDRQELSSQNFSYRDAREAFLTALTAPAPGDREAALARTFEILGHVIHLLQDMASPPHTRNDMHGGFGFGQESLYESHLNQPEVLDRLNFNGTPVRFELPRHYWITGDGRGLAEFVNRNFVSEGTNFTAAVDGAIGRGGYASPVLHLGMDAQGRPFETTLDIQTQLDPGLRDRNGNLIEGSVTFFANNFQDPITGQALRNERITTLSLFDRELQRRDESLVFTLNRYNIEAQAAFLIPRAVGYSAGLLDYFFRGRFEVALVPSAVNPAQLELRVINRSPEPLGPGRLTLYAENAEGHREAVPGAVLQMTEPVQPEAPLPVLPFTPPAGATGYVVVFEGQLGQEAAAVVGTVERTKLEAVFVGSKVGIGTGVFVATETGTFLLKQAAAGEVLHRASWGRNGNIVLIQGRLFPNTSATSWQLWRINRGPQSTQMPLLAGQAVGGVEKIDAVLVASHPTVPDLVVPGTLSANATVHVVRSLNAKQTELAIGPFGLFGPTDLLGEVQYKPLIEDTVTFPFAASGAINLDGSKVQNAMRSDPVVGYVDARDHLIVLFAITWAPGNLFTATPQNIQFWGARHPIHDAATFITIIPIPFSQAWTVPHQASYLSTPPTPELHPNVFKVTPGSPPQVQDLVIVDVTDGKVLAKSFADVTYTWTRRLYAASSGSAEFTLFHLHGFPVPGGAIDEVITGPGLLAGAGPGALTSAGVDRVVFPIGAAVGKDIADVTVTGRGFFGLHTDPPVTQQVTTFDDPGELFAGVVNLYTLGPAPGETLVEEAGGPFTPWRPRVQRQGFVFVGTQNRQIGADDAYQVVRWQFPVDPGDLETVETLFSRATPVGGDRMFVEVEAHEAAVYATFRDVNTRALLEAVLLTDVERSVPTIPGRIEFAFPAEQVNNKPGDRRLYSIVEADGTASFAQRSKPANDILGADNLGGVNPFIFFEDGVFVPNAIFHLVGE